MTTETPKVKRQDYELQVLSTGNGDRPFMVYPIDGIGTIGVHGSERFSLDFYNGSSGKVEIVMAVDGRNVLTGKKASMKDHERFVVGPRSHATLKAWPESTEGGAAFLFTDAASSVAAHTDDGDLGAIGYLSIAVFEEGYTPPVFRGRGGTFSLGDSPMRGVSRGAGPGVGAGEYTQQHIGSTWGLVQPVFDTLLQVRYFWYADLIARLRQLNWQPAQQHPTGIEGLGSGGVRTLANLGTTPRPGSAEVPSEPFRRLA